MEIDFLTLISLGISYLTIYTVVYFLYIYSRSNDREHSLFEPGVTIIIPAHNEETSIRRSIESIINQDYNGKIELIVMDDGSTDKTRKIAQSYAQVKYYKVRPSGKPQGKTKTINLAVRIAKNGIVGILDADSYLNNKAIKNMVGEFEDEKTGATVPITKVHKPKTFLEKMQMIEYTFSMCIRKLVSNTGSLFMTHGVGTLFRKKALREVGYFKENTLTEDLNIGLKLAKKGYKIKSNFKAVGYTIVPTTTKHVIKQRLRWNGGLFENSYWFRNLIFNKKYGNLGLFVLPINLIWSGVTVFITSLSLRDLFSNLYFDIRDLVITNFDWGYFFNNKLKALTTININELTIISLISLLMFLSFYYLMSKRVKLNIKESISSYVLLPFYFTVFLMLNAITVILSPIYLMKKGGKPWLTDKIT